jgi:hypothetical protein
MSINRSTILKIARRSLGVLSLAAIAISAYAILGDKGKTSKSRSLLTSQNFSVSPGSFSLKSNYDFRGNHIINTDKSEAYISLNTVITYKKGNSTLIVPLKRKIYISTVSAGFTINH